MRARVTVAVSLRDYRRRVPACLDSVKAQTLEGLDLVVVDDASTDGSPEAVLRWLGRHGRRFRSWLLVRNGRAAGLAAARNAAFERSRTPYVFVLDADNLLLPRCLEALSSALDRCGADFAYSYLHRFGEEEFLMNVRPWDPELLRRRPLVDAMALVRRSAWRRVGGFRRQAVQGWEDHDFWLRLARSGGRGVLVPEVLGRYRVHLRSMIHSISPEDWERLRAEFMREHGASLDAENAAQGPAALGVFGGQDLPLRVDSAARPGPREAKGSYLVAALSILRDLNRDLLSGKGPSGRA